MTPSEKIAYQEVLRRIAQCEREKRKVLDLRDLGLRAVPRELGRLSTLRDLWLHNNDLTTLPAEVGQLSALTELRLGNNQLTTLPAELGELSFLTRLHLQNN